MPTALIPTGGKAPSDLTSIDRRLIQRRELIRFEPVVERQSVETCVAPGFACGVNLIIPAHYLRGCDVVTPRSLGRGFIFLDESGKCGWPHDSGFYLAAYGVRWQREANGDYTAKEGFFEAVPSNRLDYQTFQNRVRSFVPPRSPNAGGIDDAEGGIHFDTLVNATYTTSSGRAITFSVANDHYDKYQWLIRSIRDPDGRVTDDQNIATWPRATGDVINSEDHSGCVTIYNRALNKGLILDMRMQDGRPPTRTEVTGVPVCPTPTPEQHDNNDHHNDNGNDDNHNKKPNPEPKPPPPPPPPPPDPCVIDPLACP
jgi:hypothetical protein